jgi:hypothetical protein
MSDVKLMARIIFFKSLASPVQKKKKLFHERAAEEFEIPGTICFLKRKHFPDYSGFTLFCERYFFPSRKSGKWLQGSRVALAHLLSPL